MTGTRNTRCVQIEDEEAIASLACYIQENLDGNLSCTILAQKACMGKTKFKQCFKEYFGCPPATYVTTARMQYAQTLLETTKMPVAEVASHVGYRKAGAFAEAFRRYSGVQPSIYRKSA